MVEVVELVKTVVLEEMVEVVEVVKVESSNETICACAYSNKVPTYNIKVAMARVFEV